MSILSSLLPRPRFRAVAPGEPLPFDEWVSYFNFGNFPLFVNPTAGGHEERISDSFGGLVQGAYKANGVVFACELARIMLFSEARFQFRRLESGRPGELFGTADLRVLEQPSPSRTTGDMLTRAMQHADYGGTAFVVRRQTRSGVRLRQPRPDWVTIILGSESDPADADVTGDDLDAELIGLLYHPGGRTSGSDPIPLRPEDVAIFAPIPDPVGRFRGIPWITPVIRNVMGHNAATSHKLKFYEHAATPQMIVSLDKAIADPRKWREWVEVLDQDHKGVANAYKTLYLGAGAQATPVGSNLAQLDFKATQGADETLIAAAAGVPAAVVGISEGLQGSSLNAGNFASSMRRFADLTMRPAWRNMAGSLATIVPPPPGAELWYDDRDIPALKDDIRDAAEVQYREGATIRQLTDAGFTPESVVAAVRSGDFSKLKHSGLYSVQLQKPQPDGANPPPVTVRPAPQALLAASTDPLENPLDEPEEIRCTNCRKLVGRRLEAGGSFEVKCRHCGTLVAA